MPLTKRRSFSPSRILALAALVLSASASARAGVLSTGAIHQNGGMECTVTNVGTKRVTVTSVSALNEDGTALSTSSGDCSFPGQIFPGLTCVVDVSPGAKLTARCVVESAGSAKNLRVHFSSLSMTDNLFDVSDAR